MSLENITNAQPGAFINGPVSGKVKFAKERDGKYGPFETAVIVVNGTDVSVMSEAPVLVPNNNKSVTFTGKGMKRKEDYNGKMQIAFGKHVTATAEGEPTPVEAHSAQTQAYPVTKQGNTGTETALNGAELANLWSSLASATKAAFKRQGFSEEVSSQAALHAPEWGALWWFGQRDIKTPEDSQHAPF